MDLLKSTPEGGKFIVLVEFGEGVEESDGLGKVFEFLELLLAILLGIVLVGLLEEGAGLFYFVFFLLQLCLAVDLVDLFGFQVLLMFKVCDFCEFFC